MYIGSCIRKFIRLLRLQTVTLFILSVCSAVISTVHSLVQWFFCGLDVEIGSLRFDAICSILSICHRMRHLDTHCAFKVRRTMDKLAYAWSATTWRGGRFQHWNCKNLQACWPRIHLWRTSCSVFNITGWLRWVWQSVSIHLWSWVTTASSQSQYIENPNHHT